MTGKQLDLFSQMPPTPTLRLEQLVMDSDVLLRWKSQILEYQLSFIGTFLDNPLGKTAAKAIAKMFLPNPEYWNLKSRFYKDFR